MKFKSVETDWNTSFVTHTRQRSKRTTPVEYPKSEVVSTRIQRRDVLEPSPSLSNRPHSMQESVVSMQKTTLHNTSLTAAAFFLIGTLAVAQAPSTARKKLPGRMKSGQIVVTKADSGNASGATTPQSTEATQRRSMTIVMTNDAQSPKARNSAHATESLAPSSNAQQGKSPLYEDKGKSGANPLFESGKDSVAKPNASTSGASGYKDPEDMTTRKAGVTQELGSDSATKKHVAGVKYENRTAAGQQSSTSTNTGNLKQDFGQVQASKR